MPQLCLIADTPTFPRFISLLFPEERDMPTALFHQGSRLLVVFTQAWV